MADGAAGCRRSGGGVPVNDSAVVKTPLRLKHGARTWRALKDGSSGLFRQTDPEIFCGPHFECNISFCSCPYDRLSLSWLKHAKFRLLCPSAGRRALISSCPRKAELKRKSKTDITLTDAQ